MVGRRGVASLGSVEQSRVKNRAPERDFEMEFESWEIFARTAEGSGEAR